MKQRLINFGMVILIIVVALGLRQISAIPMNVGDALYAMMMFFILRTLMMKSNGWFLSVLALLICYTIEFSQLYEAEWLNDFRSTTVGRLSLGSGFLWSDLWAYAAGVLLAWYLDSKIND